LRRRLVWVLARLARSIHSSNNRATLYMNNILNAEVKNRSMGGSRPNQVHVDNRLSRRNSQVSNMAETSSVTKSVPYPLIGTEPQLPSHLQKRHVQQKLRIHRVVQSRFTLARSRKSGEIRPGDLPLGDFDPTQEPRRCLQLRLIRRK
jgi:hypothetical protein